MRIKSFKFSDSFARSNSEYWKIIPTKRDDLFRITIQSLVRIVGRKEKLSFPMNILRSRWMKSRARRKEYSRFNVNLTGKVNTSTLVMNSFFFFFLCIRVTLDFEAGRNIIRLEVASAMTRFTGLVIIADRIIKCQKICGDSRVPRR